MLNRRYAALILILASASIATGVYYYNSQQAKPLERFTQASGEGDGQRAHVLMPFGYLP